MIGTVPVVKMSGAGNDFIVLHGTDARRLGDRFVAWVRDVCRRGTSLGADGVVVIDTVSAHRIRAEYRNADGSLAFCGNGTRCAARFAHHTGLTGPELVIETAAGDVVAEVFDHGVRISIPAPRDCGAHTVDVEGHPVQGRRVLAGVPHFVVEVDNVQTAPLELWGPAIRRHPSFGEDGTNLDVVAFRGDAGVLDLRTWERGVEGETLACGSGAIAAALAARLRGHAETVVVVPRSGYALTVSVPSDGEPAMLEGDARVVLRGEVLPGAVDRGATPARGCGDAPGLRR